MEKDRIVAELERVSKSLEDCRECGIRGVRINYE